MPVICPLEANQMVSAMTRLAIAKGVEIPAIHSRPVPPVKRPYRRSSKLTKFQPYQPDRLDLRLQGIAQGIPSFARYCMQADSGVT
jgi:hypothetical protein